MATFSVKLKMRMSFLFSYFDILCTVRHLKIQKGSGFKTTVLSKRSTSVLYIVMLVQLVSIYDIHTYLMYPLMSANNT